MAEQQVQQQQSEDFNVLIAVDQSTQAEETVNYYLNNLHKEDNRVILLHVVEIPESANEARHEMLSAHAITELWKEGQEKAKALETKYADLMRAKGVTKIKLRTEGSLKPGHTICKAADSEHAKVIVMGTRGMGVVRRTFLGSVSDYVLHHAHCPVLVVRK